MKHSTILTNRQLTRERTGMTVAIQKLLSTRIWDAATRKTRPSASSELSLKQARLEDTSLKQPERSRSWTSQRPGVTLGLRQVRGCSEVKGSFVGRPTFHLSRHLRA